MQANALIRDRRLAFFVSGVGRMSTPRENSIFAKLGVSNQRLVRSSGTCAKPIILVDNIKTIARRLKPLA